MRVDVTKSALEATFQKYVNLAELNSRITKLADELLRKNSDYGDAWQTWGIFTPLIRLNDKLLRLKKGAEGGVYLVADEGIKDTLRDIVGYGILALLWLDKNEDIAALIDDILDESAQ